MQDVVTTTGVFVEIGWHSSKCPTEEKEKKIKTRVSPNWDELHAEHMHARRRQIDQLVKVTQEITQTNRELQELRDAWLQAKHLYSGDQHAETV